MTMIVVFGEHDENTMTQMKDVASRAAHTALMADGHLGYIMPIGGVAAYRNHVSVAGVGYDIACGNAAIRTDLTLTKLCDLHVQELDRNPSRINNSVLRQVADEISATISFGIGRTNKADDAPTDDPLFLDPAWYGIPNEGRYRDDLRDKARLQLGTVGSGNHYVDVFVDEDNYVWVGVHFGSRGLGHTIASNMMALAQGEPWGTRVKEEEALLDLDTPLGDAYWQLMTLAGTYAYAGREWVARKVVAMLGAKETRLVHNHHNFAWKEHHIILEGSTLPDIYEEEFVVVRKGATPAFSGQEGFVGGSMGDDSVILHGADTTTDDNEEVRRLQQLSLYSTVHGAGRVMSRSQALGKVHRKTGQLKLGADGEPLRVGKVSQEMMDRWLLDKGVIRRGGGRDESPHVYRRLEAVLEEQGGTIEVETRLRPLVVAMAGANEFDPYKD